jgi:RNA polymerase sigma-70 factor (ECF subfamily)
MAFETLYLCHREALLGFIGNRYRCLDTHAIQDVLSEVFLRVWQSRTRLGSVINFRAYVKGVAKNIVARQFRNKNLTEQKLLPEAESPALSPYAAIEQDELFHRITRALESLTLSHRLALELNVDGLSAKQIAARTGHTEKAIQRQIEKARQRLKLALVTCGNR